MRRVFALIVLRSCSCLAVVVSPTLLSSGCDRAEVAPDAGRQGSERLGADEPGDGSPRSAADASELRDAESVDAGRTIPAPASGPDAEVVHGDAGASHTAPGSDDEGVSAWDAASSFDAASNGDATDDRDDGGVEPDAAPPRDAWFVDSVTGHDSNDGRTSATPFASLARLEASPIAGYSVVYLARGSFWREQLTILPSGVEVRAYGSGERPIIDGSDVAANSMFHRTEGTAYVYEIAWPHDFGPDEGKSAHRVWEDGTRLRRVNDLAACDAIPGSFYAPPPTLGGPDTIYVHASDESSIPDNGKLYELTRRRWALQLYAWRNHASVYSVHTRRNAHADGSLVVDGLISDCLAEDGRIHNVFIRGIAEDTTAWKIEPPPGYGGASMFVTYEDQVDLPGVIYRRCHAIADADALGPNGGANQLLMTGFYGHTALGRRFGAALYEECDASGVSQAFAFQQVDAAVYYKCSAPAGQRSVSAYAEDTLAILGGSYRTDVLNASLVRFEGDDGKPRRIIIRGVRSITDGPGGAQAIWVNLTGSHVEVSRSTFIAMASRSYLAAGSFDFRNNLFYGTDFRIRLYPAATYLGDENLYYKTSKLTLIFEIGNNDDTLGLPVWQGATGQDLNSVDADPLFLGSPAMGDFLVDPASPASLIGAGADYDTEQLDVSLRAIRDSLTQGLRQ